METSGGHIISQDRYYLISQDRYYLEPAGACLGEDAEETHDLVHVMDRKRWDSKGQPFCCWGYVRVDEGVRVAAQMNTEAQPKGATA